MGVADVSTISKNGGVRGGGKFWWTIKVWNWKVLVRLLLRVTGWRRVKGIELERRKQRLVGIHRCYIWVRRKNASK